jgi:hypothetical protein
MGLRKRSSKKTGKRPKHLEGRYANYFEVGHNAFEFVFDFGQYHPESESARMHTRVVTGPVYAKLLADLLRDSVQRFEEEHGSIQTTDLDPDPTEFVKESVTNYNGRLKGRRKTGEERPDD